MRMTIDLPDPLYRKIKAVAALRGSTMKDLIIRTVEREVTGGGTPTKGKRVKLPLITSWTGRKLDLTGYEFDELLG